MSEHDLSAANCKVSESPARNTEWICVECLPDDAPNLPKTVQDREVRVTSETGGEKGRKLARFGLIPAEVLWAVAEHYGKGALKYEDNNWAKGYSWSLSYDALQRHANLFWMGADEDDEGFNHLAAVIFHAATLLYNSTHHPEFDDRLKP